MDKLGWHSLGTSFACPCGATHSLPIRACVVAPGAHRDLAEYARAHCGPHAFVLSDENTRAVGGDAVLSALASAGKRITEKVYGNDPIDATTALGEEVRAAAGGCDFLVAIGSGSLGDLAKYAGDKLQRPVLLYPTAASMNGYTSGIVAVKVNGLKRTLPCQPAEGIFADPDVCATAPARMTAAGIADFLSKSSSSTDWCVAHRLRGGYFCERPREFFDTTTESVLHAAPLVGRGDRGAYKTVLEALMLSGFSMVLAGSSAPASGGEHLISHFIDMKAALDGSPHDLHGTQVGVATIHCLGLWERILALDPARIDIHALADSQPSEESIRACIDADWGPIAPEVQAQWAEKRLTPEALASELSRFRDLLPSLREECKGDLLPPSAVEDAIAASGGPVRPEDLTVPPEVYRDAVLRARYIRNRFTVLDLARELGIE